MSSEVKYCPICRAALKKGKSHGGPRRFCPECGWVYYENPLPSVVALTRNPAGEVLLVKRGVEPHKGRWALPSGFVEAHESPEEACLRELKEETNLHGTILGLIGIYSEITKLYGRVLLIAYAVEPAKGKARAGSDTRAVRFFSQKELPHIPLLSHRKIVRDGLGQRAASGPLREVLKSKITRATISKTELFYQGSIGIDAGVAERADLLPGEKVEVLNYNSGERFETYVIREKRNSGIVALYGPAARKGSVGDEVCILSYVLADTATAKNIEAKIVHLDERNRLRNQEEC